MNNFYCANKQSQKYRQYENWNQSCFSPYRMKWLSPNNSQYTFRAPSSQKYNSVKEYCDKHGWQSKHVYDAYMHRFQQNSNLLQRLIALDGPLTYKCRNPSKNKYSKAYVWGVDNINQSNLRKIKQNKMIHFMLQGKVPQNRRLVFGRNMMGRILMRVRNVLRRRAILNKSLKNPKRTIIVKKKTQSPILLKKTIVPRIQKKDFSINNNNNKNKAKFRIIMPKPVEYMEPPSTINPPQLFG